MRHPIRAALLGLIILGFGPGLRHATAQGHYRDDDFWEDRFTAMRKIWGTPYVPLGYYWDRVQGLPPRPAPVAPGVIADRPIYPGYGWGRHGGYSHHYGRGRGYGWGHYRGGYGYPGYGYRPPFRGPYGGYRYGW